MSDFLTFIGFITCVLYFVISLVVMFSMYKEVTYYKDVRVRTEFVVQCILHKHDHLDENEAKKCIANYMDKSFKYND